MKKNNFIQGKTAALSTCLVLSLFATAASGSPDPQPDIEDIPGNLIVNGNFEQLDNSQGERNGRALDDVSWRGWDIYQTIPGWFTSFGVGIEVQRGHRLDPPANGGGVVIELVEENSSAEAGNSWMTQKVTNLTPGENYNLNFLYHRNRDTGSASPIAVYWGERLPGKNACIADSGQNTWVDIQCVVTATASDMYLTFAAFGGGDSSKWGGAHGGKIDVVQLNVAAP